VYCVADGFGNHVTFAMRQVPEDELIPTRATLLQRLRNWQDESSWQDFFDTYWKLIYDLAVKGGLNRSEAEDVVQETLVAVAKHIPTFKYDPTIGSFKGWLFNMVRWRIADQLRKRGPVTGDCLREETGTGTRMVERVADPSSLVLNAIWEAEWEKTLLHAAVTKIKQRLDPQMYQIFDFYVNKQWPAEKVAETFKVSVGQVYLAKNRVTGMIKEEVKRLESEMT
jgi:RNA polymerase sigma factor (sigma-70 family)